MLFRQLFEPVSCTYSYLIADRPLQAAILVDSVLETVERDLKLLKELDLTLQYCLETHVHADHITGAEKLRQATNCLTIVPDKAHVSCADRYIKDGEIIALGSITLEAIATPGHTDSHMAYLLQGSPHEPQRILTGDALFIRGCGRTDFQSGDPGTLYNSVHQRLFSLPDNTAVYPGHDYRGQTVSSIVEEKRWNPRFAGRDRDDFIKFMNNLKLPNPKKMMEAVPANEQCGQVIMGQ